MGRPAPGRRGSSGPKALPAWVRFALRHLGCYKCAVPPAERSDRPVNAIPGRWPLLGLFLAALLVRAAFVVLEPPAHKVGDEGMWKAMGRELASPEVAFSPLRSRLITHPPLYPYMIGGLLAVFGHGDAIKWAQALLGALLVPAVGLLGGAAYGRRVGLLAAAFAAFDPALVWQSTHLWSEVLFLALLWWSFERLVARRYRGQRRRGGRGGSLLGARDPDP